MKCIFIAIQLYDGETISLSELSLMFNAPINRIKICPLRECKGNERAFKYLADYYLWTNRYYQGIHESKLTFIRIKGAEKISDSFSLKYSNSIKLALISDTVEIIKMPNDLLTKEIHTISRENTGEDREEKLKKYSAILESHYKIIRLVKN